MRSQCLGVCRNRVDVERSGHRLGSAVAPIIHEGQTKDLRIQRRQHRLETAPITEPAVQHYRSNRSAPIHYMTNCHRCLTKTRLYEATEVQTFCDPQSVWRINPDN